MSLTVAEQSLVGPANAHLGTSWKRSRSAAGHCGVDDQHPRVGGAVEREEAAAAVEGESLDAVVLGQGLALDRVLADQLAASRIEEDLRGRLGVAPAELVGADVDAAVARADRDRLWLAGIADAGEDPQVVDVAAAARQDGRRWHQRQQGERPPGQPCAPLASRSSHVAARVADPTVWRVLRRIGEVCAMAGLPAGRDTAQTMSRENVETFEKALDAFNRRDRTAWLAFYDPEFENVPPRSGPNPPPFGVQRKSGTSTSRSGAMGGSCVRDWRDDRRRRREAGGRGRGGGQAVAWQIERRRGCDGATGRWRRTAGQDGLRAECSPTGPKPSKPPGCRSSG